MDYLLELNVIFLEILTSGFQFWRIINFYGDALMNALLYSDMLFTVILQRQWTSEIGVRASVSGL